MLVHSKQKTIEFVQFFVKHILNLIIAFVNLAQWDFSSYYANIVMLEGVSQSLKLDSLFVCLT